MGLIDFSTAFFLPFSFFTVALNFASFGLIHPPSKDIFAILIEAK
jgi:hypothetical protein